MDDALGGREGRDCGRLCRFLCLCRLRARMEVVVGLVRVLYWGGIGVVAVADLRSGRCFGVARKVVGVDPVGIVVVVERYLRIE